MSDLSQEQVSSAENHPLSLIANQAYVKVSRDGVSRRKGLGAKYTEFDPKNPLVVLSGDVQIGADTASIYLSQDALTFDEGRGINLAAVLSTISSSNKDIVRKGDAALTYAVPGTNLVVTEYDQREYHYPGYSPEGDGRSDFRMNPEYACYNNINNAVALRRAFPDGHALPDVTLKQSGRYAWLGQGNKTYIVEERVDGAAIDRFPVSGRKDALWQMIEKARAVTQWDPQTKMAKLLEPLTWDSGKDRVLEEIRIAFEGKEAHVTFIVPNSFVRTRTADELQVMLAERNPEWAARLGAEIALIDRIDDNK